MILSMEFLWAVICLKVVSSGALPALQKKNGESFISQKEVEQTVSKLETLNAASAHLVDQHDFDHDVQPALGNPDPRMRTCAVPFSAAVDISRKPNSKRPVLLKPAAASKRNKLSADMSFATSMNNKETQKESKAPSNGHFSKQHTSRVSTIITRQSSRGNRCRRGTKTKPVNGTRNPLLDELFCFLHASLIRTLKSKPCKSQSGEDSSECKVANEFMVSQPSIRQGPNIEQQQDQCQRKRSMSKAVSLVSMYGKEKLWSKHDFKKKSPKRQRDKASRPKILRFQWTKSPSRFNYPVFDQRYHPGYDQHKLRSSFQHSKDPQNVGDFMQWMNHLHALQHEPKNLFYHPNNHRKHFSHPRITRDNPTNKCSTFGVGHILEDPVSADKLYEYLLSSGSNGIREDNMSPIIQEDYPQMQQYTDDDYQLEELPPPPAFSDAQNVQDTRDAELKRILTKVDQMFEKLSKISTETSSTEPNAGPFEWTTLGSSTTSRTTSTTTTTTTTKTTAKPTTKTRKPQTTADLQQRIFTPPHLLFVPVTSVPFQGYNVHIAANVYEDHTSREEILTMPTKTNRPSHFQPFETSSITTWSNPETTTSLPPSKVKTKKVTSVTKKTTHPTETHTRRTTTSSGPGTFILFKMRNSTAVSFTKSPSLAKTTLPTFLSNQISDPKVKAHFVSFPPEAAVAKGLTQKPWPGQRTKAQVQSQNGPDDHEPEEGTSHTTSKFSRTHKFRPSKTHTVTGSSSGHGAETTSKTPQRTTSKYRYIKACRYKLTTSPSSYGNSRYYTKRTTTTPREKFIIRPTRKTSSYSGIHEYFQCPDEEE